MKKTKSHPLSYVVRCMGENGKLDEDIVKILTHNLMSYMRECLSNGSRIELRRFGTFGVRHRGAVNASHPRTGERMVVDACWLPYFRPGRILLKKIRGGDDGKKGDKT